VSAHLPQRLDAEPTAPAVLLRCLAFAQVLPDNPMNAPMSKTMRKGSFGKLQINNSLELLEKVGLPGRTTTLGPASVFLHAEH
jgi:hypothetical protein